MKKYLFIFLITISNLASSNIYNPNHPAAQNLVSFWDLKDGTGTTVTDPVANIKATLINNPIWTENGLLFSSAKSQYVKIGIVPQIAALKTTYSIHAKFKSTKIGEWQAILSHGNYGHYLSSRYSVGGFNRPLYGRQNDAAKQINAKAGIFGDNKWHTITVSVAPTGSKFYIDGNLDTSSALSAFSLNNNLELRIGGCVSQGEYFTGEIENVLFYNKALTQEEVTSLSEGNYPVFEEIPASVVLTKTNELSSYGLNHSFNLTNINDSTAELILATLRSFIDISLDNLSSLSLFEIWIDTVANNNINPYSIMNTELILNSSTESVTSEFNLFESSNLLNIAFSGNIPNNVIYSATIDGQTNTIYSVNNNSVLMSLKNKPQLVEMKMITFTPTFTSTPTNTNTFTATPTDTATPTNTFTPTNTDTPTATPTITPSWRTYSVSQLIPFVSYNIQSPTGEGFVTVKFQGELTQAIIADASGNATFEYFTNNDDLQFVFDDIPTPTFTNTNTFTPTFTSTNTFTPTNTNTFTATPTASNTPTATITPTPTNTLMPTPTRPAIIDQKSYEWYVKWWKKIYWPKWAQ